MDRAEQNATVTAGLYETRRVAKVLLGAGYDETLKPYREWIARVMTDEGLPALRAALKIGKTIPESEAIPLMCVIAAAVDIIEQAARRTA